MGNSRILQNINWGKVTRKTFRFIWALTVLIIKLLWIFIAFFICVLFGIKSSEKPKPSKEKYTPVLKPHVMYLKKTDSQFEVKRNQLKADGYLWHSGLKAWAQPSVKLDRNQANFYDKTIELKKLGYSWHKTSGLWELTFPKYQVIRVYQHSVTTEA